MARDNITKVMLGLFCVVFPLVLLLLSYNIVISVASLSPEQEKWMDYFTGDERSDERRGDYTALELTHMDDVKQVIQRVEGVFWGVMGVGLLLAGYLYRRKELVGALKYGGVTAFGGVVVILIWALVSFNSLFRIFHLVLFPQGNWQFGTDSVLIQTFPIEFFIEMAVKIFGLTLVLAGGVAGVVVVAGYWLKKRKKRG